MSGPNTVEIERKFLVNTALLPLEARQEGDDIRQGYLSFKPTVRVRVREKPGTSSGAWLTIKGPGSLVRSEFEYNIPLDHAEALLGLSRAILSKTRYNFRVGAHTWEIDQYHDRLDGLWTAEIELTSPDEAYERPEWVTTEVTEDPRYSNAAMARDGWP